MKLFPKSTGATTSVSQAAFLVSIFWAAVTIGRAVAVGQALLVGPSWSLRLQLFISLCGATAFYVLGAESFKGAAVAAGEFLFLSEGGKEGGLLQ